MTEQREIDSLSLHGPASSRWNSTRENIMRPSLLFSLTVILMIFAAVGMAASEPPESALTEREAAMQAEINRFET